MRSDPHGHVHVARSTAARANVPLARYSKPFAIGYAGRQTSGHGLAPRFLTGSSARLARARPLPAGAAARAATPREDHVPAHRPHRARSLAQVARPRTRPCPAAAATDPAMVAPRHGQGPWTA